MRPVFTTGRVPRCSVWVLAIAGADGWGWWCRIGRKAGIEAKVELRCAIPHALDAWCKAMNGLPVALIVVDEVGC
jgi:hypothetical protein